MRAVFLIWLSLSLTGCATTSQDVGDFTVNGASFPVPFQFVTDGPAGIAILRFENAVDTSLYLNYSFEWLPLSFNPVQATFVFDDGEARPLTTLHAEYEGTAGRGGGIRVGPVKQDPPSREDRSKRLEGVETVSAEPGSGHLILTWANRSSPARFNTHWQAGTVVSIIAFHENATGVDLTQLQEGITATTEQGGVTYGAAAELGSDGPMFGVVKVGHPSTEGELRIIGSDGVRRIPFLPVTGGTRAVFTAVGPIRIEVDSASAESVRGAIIVGRVPPGIELGDIWEPIPDTY